jgi:hypothetical protein
MRRFHNVMFRALGHRYCCHVPAWTAYVGFRWQPIDEGRWNLYNTIWRPKDRIRISMG